MFNALNVRLDAKAIAFILQHAETKVLFTDREYSNTIKAALELLSEKPVVIDIDDPYFTGGNLLGDMIYDDLLATGDPQYRCFQVKDEWQAIALNYTSGTTGDPKGVVYHHRGAYLNAISMALCWDMSGHPVYLWTLPMFHCNGWCFPDARCRYRHQRLFATRSGRSGFSMLLRRTSHTLLRSTCGAQHP